MSEFIIYGNKFEVYSDPVWIGVGGYGYPLRGPICYYVNGEPVGKKEFSKKLEQAQKSSGSTYGGA